MQNQSDNITEEIRVEGLAGKYLTFALSEEKYGIGILKVQEIIGVTKITRVPRSPAYINGVINLRGKIIPVIDLRAKFEMPTIEYDRTTCIIVVRFQVEEKDVTLGVIVDTVLEVVDFSESMIQPAPEYGANMSTQFIIGMGQVEHDDHTDVIILTDIDKALSHAEVDQVAELSQEEQGEED